MADRVGSVEAGKQGDLVIWDAPDLDYICYRFGSNLVRTVIKRAAWFKPAGCPVRKEADRFGPD